MPHPQDFLNAAYTIGWSFLITIILGYIVLRIFPRTPFFNKLTLAAVESAQEGFQSVDTLSNLVGEKGIALNNLRPVGKAEINNIRIDVVTEGDYIEKDTPVVVTEVHGSRIVVREIDKI